MDLEQRLARFDDTDLYVVITEAFCAGRPALEVLDGVLQAGVKLVQVREKDLSDSDYFERARGFRKRTEKAGALLIVDDRVDIALAVGADGVHLGQNDLPFEVALTLAPNLILGASTHNLDEALQAQEAGAHVLNIGPVFATQTKLGTVSPVGPEMIGHIAPHLNVPFTCMGGIKPGNIQEVLDKGARHVAVVTAVTAQQDVRNAAETLRKIMQKHKL